MAVSAVSCVVSRGEAQQATPPLGLPSGVDGFRGAQWRVMWPMMKQGKKVVWGRRAWSCGSSSFQQGLDSSLHTSPHPVWLQSSPFARPQPSHPDTRMHRSRNLLSTPTDPVPASPDPNLPPTLFSCTQASDIRDVPVANFSLLLLPVYQV